MHPDCVENSAIKGLYYDVDGTLYGVCGEKEQYFFSIVDNKLASLAPIEEADPDKVKKALCRDVQELDLKMPLPHYPGRQYKAVPSSAVTIKDGAILVGTTDGMLALVKDGNVHGLGPAAVNGPVHCMAATPDGTKVYGVAGAEEDIANLFSYDSVAGLRWLGIFEQGAGENPKMDDLFCMMYVRSCAISPDGKYLAVGADERLGMVVFYEL